jgi:hypothetical protein
LHKRNADTPTLKLEEKTYEHATNSAKLSLEIQEMPTQHMPQSLREDIGVSSVGKNYSSYSSYSRVVLSRVE